EQYLIPYFIAAHPGTSDEDMMNLALWLKRNGFRADQVQTFYPSPMAMATAMYHSGNNPLHRISRRRGDKVVSAKGLNARRLHKAFLRYHDPDNWPLLREALKKMGRGDLIGNGRHQLIPRVQPQGWQPRSGSHTTRKGGGRLLTQHTGLPARVSGAGSRRARKTQLSQDHISLESAVKPPRSGGSAVHAVRRSLTCRDRLARVVR